MQPRFTDNAKEVLSLAARFARSTIASRIDKNFIFISNPPFQALYAVFSSAA